MPLRYANGIFKLFSVSVLAPRVNWRADSLAVNVPIAQWIEHLTSNLVVVGSNPTRDALLQRGNAQTVFPEAKHAFKDTPRKKLPPDTARNITASLESVGGKTVKTHVTAWPTCGLCQYF